MKSKRLLLTLLLALVVPWAAMAQSTTLDWGSSSTYSGTDNNANPFGRYYGYEYRVYLYPPSTMPFSGDITQLEFLPNGTLSAGGQIDVWMKTTTTITSLDNTTSFATYKAGATQVYTSSSSPAFTQGEYVAIPLSTSIAYNHSNNEYLMILVRSEANSASGDGGRSFYYYNPSGTSKNTWWAKKDSSDPGESAAPSSFSNYGTGDYLPVVRFTFTGTVVPTFSLSPSSATIFTGFSETLTATYDNITDPTIAYTSSNTSVATVSGSGTTATVTAVAPGTATITATMNGTYTATCEVTVEDPHYCTPVLTSTTTSSYITNFTTTGAYSNLNNSSTGTGASYSDYYDSNSASAYEGMTVGFTVTYVGGSAGVAIWVDWNNDLDFTDDGERVYNTTGYKNSPHSGSFTIPNGALLGDHRMRVVIDWNNTNPADPCTASRGEYEDYKLTIIEVPDCVPVNALTVDEPNVTATQIPISWTAGGTETRWNIRWRKYGTTSAYSTETVTTTSYTIPGLTALTKYEFGVQAGCDEDDIWVDGSYTTACPDYQETPFTQNFNSLTSGIPQCWNNDEGTTTYASYKWNYSSSGHSGACVSFNSYYNTSGYDNYLKTPVISLPSDQDMQLSFWYKNSSTNSTNQFIVYIATEDDDYATRTALTDNLKGKSSWTEHAPIDLSTYRGKKIMLLFYGKSAYDYTYMYLDDVTLRAAPDCATPTGLAVTSGSQTPEGATITWTAGDATSWIVEYKKSTDEDYTAITPAVNEATYTFTGLDYSSTYYARVKVNCTGVTYPTDPVSFNTKAQFPAPTNFQASNLTHNSVCL